jgi:hypothetical protein
MPPFLRTIPSFGPLPLQLLTMQGHVIVKLNLSIFRLIAGHGYLFFWLCPYNMAPYWAVSKWFIAP